MASQNHAVTSPLDQQAFDSLNQHDDNYFITLPADLKALVFSYLACPDVVFNILLVGVDGCGKTSLGLRWIENAFTPGVRHGPIYATLFSFRQRTVHIHQAVVRVRVWFLVPRPLLQAAQAAICARAHGVMLLFDNTNKHSFVGVQSGHERVTRHRQQEELAWMVCATKWDGRPARGLRNQALEFAGPLSAPFYETSAKTGDNVDDAFAAMIDAIYHKTRGRKQ